LFGFLTTAANAVVAPIHPEAMPVVLTTPTEVEIWLKADTPDALALQGRCATTSCTSSRAARKRTAWPPSRAQSARVRPNRLLAKRPGVAAEAALRASAIPAYADGL
jgi:putative SOS response-associated peptidase YedK